MRAGLWIDPALEHTIDEGGRYHYPENVADRYGDVKPVKKDDHFMDGKRYLVSKVAPLRMPRGARSRTLVTMAGR